MDKKTRYARAYVVGNERPENLIAEGLKACDPARVEAVRDVIRRQCVKPKLGADAIDCLALLLLASEEHPHKREISDDDATAIRREVKLLESLTKHYEERDSSIKDEWRKPWSCPVWKIASNAHEMGIMAERRLADLRFRLFWNGLSPIFDDYAVEIPSLKDEYRFELAPRTTDAGKPGFRIPLDCYAFVMDTVLTEARVRGGAERRYEIIKQLFEDCGDRKISSASVKEYVTRVRKLIADDPV